MTIQSLLLVGCDADGNGNPVTFPTRECFRVETQDFEAGDSPLLIVETFVGAISISQTSSDSIYVVVTKWAAAEEDLDTIQVDTIQIGREVRVVATNPSDRQNVGVDVEARVPEDSSVDLGAAVGSVLCTGRPRGTWDLGAGVGSIGVVLPVDVNARVDLATGVGRVRVEFDVAGDVSTTRVVGTVGSGAEGEIIARCGVGDISALRN
jgi:hypothetical protein